MRRESGVGRFIDWARAAIIGEYFATHLFNVA
jgi:hypothetical protein